MSTGKMWENFERRQKELQIHYGGSSGPKSFGGVTRATAYVKRPPGKAAETKEQGYYAAPPPGWVAAPDEFPPPRKGDNWSFSKSHDPTGSHPHYQSGGPSQGARPNVIPLPTKNPYVINSNYYNYSYNQGNPRYSPQASAPPQQHVPDPFSYTKGKRLEGHRFDASPYPEQFIEHQAPFPDPNFGVAGDQSDEMYDANGYGHDSEIFEGFQKKRKCRDLVCLGIFAGLCAVMVGVLVYGIVNAQSLDYFVDAVDDCIVDTTYGARTSAMILKQTPWYERPSNPSTRYDFPECFLEDRHEHDVKLWYYVLYASLIAIGLSFVMTILLRFFAGPIVWTVYVLMIILCIGAIAAVWIVRSQLLLWDSYFLIVAISVTIIAALYLVLLIFMRKRVALVVRLFKEAGKALHGVPFVLFQPLWTLVAHLIVTGIFGLILVLLQTSRLTNYKDNGTCSLPTFAIVGTALNIVAYLWMWQFVLGCQHTVIAGAVSRWFFIRDKTNLGFPILASYKQLVVYNLGSVAVGSFIIAVVKFIRWLARNAKRAASTRNAVAKIVGICIYCCVACFEQLISYLCRNAYIEMSIYGYGFFPAAKRAAKVIANNAFRMSAINSIGDFVLFLSKFLIVIATGVAAYFMIYNASCETELVYVWTAVSVLFAYFIAHCFMSIYEMTIDTIFICFCEDCDKNDGMQKPYFMSKGLMKFVEDTGKLKKDKKDS